MNRPKIAPDLAAALTAAVPARLLRKLDAQPALAEAWEWDEDAVTTHRDDVVHLAIEGGVVTGVTCSCLLSPRCLHVAAVVAALEPTEPTEPAESREPPSSPAATSGAPPPASSAASSAASAAAATFRVVADVLAAGAEACGAFAQAELLRSIHACRSEGLHRLASAQTRALRSIRELRADRPEFTLGVLAADLREALDVAHALSAGAADPPLRGTARRDYEPIGNLRLHGVLTEAVVTRSGYAGAITYLAAETGALYTRADVAPGDAGRAAAAYDAAAGLGDAILPHRELCRGGLFVEHATGSADGRLGAGHKVRAVRATEPSRWDRPPIDARFRTPLADQLARIAARDGDPDELRPAGWDLAFIEGVIAGGPAGLAVPRGDGGDDILLRLSPAPHRMLPGRDNLAVLARGAGLRVRAIGRVRLNAPRELDLLAIGPAPGEQRFTLPEAWHGRANVQYDRISPLSMLIAANGHAAAPAAAASTAAPAPSPDDLLAPLRRRVERAVLGGAGTLPVHALAELEREAASLDDRALSGGAGVLRDLAALAHEPGRDPSGARRTLDRSAFARAWLRAALYEAVARRRLGVASW